MPGLYDDSLKKLIDANPQDFIALVLGSGTFEKALPHELKSVHIRADALLKVVDEKGPLLVHLELQSSNDPFMQERLLEYNTLASREHGYLPVCSCVIYLKKDGEIPTPPFIRKLPNGEEVVRLYYKFIELYKCIPEQLFRLNGIGLLPLVTLTNGGTAHEVVETMIDRLVSTKQNELLVIANTIASLAFERESEAEQQWVERMFAMLNDTLRNTRAYQKILKEGREEGLEQGLEQGRQEILQQELQKQRQMLLNIIISRFPQLLQMAKKHIDVIQDTEIMLPLLLNMTTVPTVEQAKQLLINASGLEGQD